MEATAAQAILHNQTQLSSWVTPPIHLTVCKSPWTNDTIDIDLVQTIGKNNSTRPFHTCHEGKYYLPPEFNQNTPQFRSTVLNPLITNACKNAKIKVYSKGWEGKKQRFVCS